MREFSEILAPLVYLYFLGACSLCNFFMCVSVFTFYTCVCFQGWLRSVHPSLFWRRTCSQLHLNTAMLRTHWSLSVNVCCAAVTLSGYPPSLWELEALTHTHRCRHPIHYLLILHSYLLSQTLESEPEIHHISFLRNRSQCLPCSVWRFL